VNLRAKIENSAEPVVFYEIVPPRAGVAGELESRLELVRDVASQVDAINIPEIRDESGDGSSGIPLKDRIEPRVFAEAIAGAAPVETVVNRVTVHELAAEQRRWLKESCSRYGVRSMIFVGGALEIAYPGPSVVEACSLAQEERLPLLLGGITIPHRPEEAARVRAKQQRGMSFFTTQVLLTATDVVRLLHELDGMETRLLLSFTPVCHPRDLAFLQRLGVDVPPKFAEEITGARTPDEATERSFALARRILTEVFENLPPHPPALGLQVERITKRNSAAARRMLAELGDFYRRLTPRHYPPARIGAEAAPTRAGQARHAR
jgi:5,10-methylenetetrahydrofolate reductase